MVNDPTEGCSMHFNRSVHVNARGDGADRTTYCNQAIPQVSWVPDENTRLGDVC